MESNWLVVLQVATIVFVAGGMVATLYQVRSDVRSLWHRFDALNAREQRRYMKIVVVLTEIANSKNPGNDFLRRHVQSMIEEEKEEIPE